MSTRILPLVLFVSQVFGARYKHLGCFPFMEPTSEVDGLKYHYADLELFTCAEGCRRQGFPFIALQKGQNCLCSTAYGKSNPTYGSACNITCRTDQIFTCGGMTAETLYYTIDAEQAKDETRVDVIYNTSSTFAEARKSCIKGEGDLVTLKNIQHLDELANKLQTSDVQGPVWIGAYMNSWDINRKWTSPNIRGLDVSDISMLWAPGHPEPGTRCTLLDTKLSAWVSADCGETHPFICRQVPPVITATSTEDVASSNIKTPPPTRNPADAIWKEKSRHILYWILPSFIFCFFGSCFYYCAYKLYMACRNKHLRKQQHRSQTIHVRSFENAQIFGFDDDEERLVDTARDSFRSRPITARDVSMNEDEMLAPPPIARTDKEEAERRKQMAIVNMGFDRKEDEDDIDFTKLTLTEILYIRGMLGEITQKRKKKRKVLSA